MTRGKPTPVRDPNQEIAALIETLHSTGRRLEQLTAGEVDAVADRDGHMFLLRHAQEQLRDSEAAKQAAILDALPAHVVLLDARGTIISVNEGWRKFANANGLKGPHYGIGINYLDICDSARGEDATEAGPVAAGIRSVMAGAAHEFSVEYPCHSPTQKRWFLMTVTPLADEPPHGVVVMHLDISEQTRAEEVRRRFVAAMDAIADGIFLTDRTTMTYLHVNDAACRQQNLTRDELLALGPMRLLGKSRAEIERDYDAVIGSGAAAEPFELLWTRADGSPLWVELRRHAQWSTDRWTMVTLVRDITERKRAEQELRESERRFSDMLGNVELISLMLDREARITFCNEYLLRLTGWQREDVIGRNWFEHFIPTDFGDAKDVFEAALLNLPSAWHHENEILTRSGERRLIRWNNSVLRSASGEVTGIASIGEDITEQRRAEARILRLNRVYAVQSGINALIVRVHDRDELFREACRIAVEAGAFRTAWIGVIDPQTLDGKVVAWYGADQSYVDMIKLAPRNATSDSEPPACRALRLGQTVICNDIATEPSLAPRRDVLMQRGYRSVGCFPLTLAGRPEAVIALFAGERDYFDAEEVQLLVDLAANLSFALDNLEQEKTLKKIDAQRQQGEESLRRFSSAMDATADAIYLVDRTSMRFIHVNDAACRMQGQTREELLALGPMALLATSRAELERTYDSIIASGADAEPLELLRLRKDGSQAWVELRRHAQRSGERWTIITLVRDITERKRATQELRESEARFRGLTALSTDWYWQQDEALRFVAFSGGDHVAGWGADQLSWVGLRRWEIPGITPLKDSWNEHQALLRAHKPFRNFEYQRQASDGGLRYVAASGEPIFDAGGGFTGYRGVATDITERKETENRIRRLNRVYAVLSGINTLIVRVRDRDELFREACRVAVDAGGFRLAWIGLVVGDSMELIPVAAAGSTLDSGTLVNQRFSLLEDAPRGNALSACAIRERKVVFTNDVPNDPRIVFKAEHAQRGSRSMAILPLLVADEAVGVLALYAEETGFFDEEELKLLTELAGDIAFAIDHIEKAAKLNYLAYYDPLTGLANRSLFLDRVAQYMRSALASGHQMAMFLIDLERFKNINDSLGRPAGDALLLQVAEWLTSRVEDAGLLARMDADHFVVVLPEVAQDCDVARHLETTMEALVEHPFRLNDSIFRIAARVGVALFPDDGADAETLFRNAEAALKQAKASGERYLFYTRNMSAMGAGKLTLENQLRQALDNDEFVLHYQPKVNLASGKVVGAEALIRWNDPRTGLVPPGRFIPILEETGLIYEVGRWALRQAIADYLRWRNAGLPAVRIAVNVSPLQLRNRGFIDEIRQVVDIDPQAAAGLELEITESLIMEDVKHNIASLQAIRAMSISIAIDDFGTGFSSLSYLAKLPVDTLKIDRSFVIDMTAGPQGLALVSTIVKLAHSLKLKAVAEGVETEEQQHLLHLLDCDEMQGYLFSKPVPAEDFEARYLTRSAAAAT